MLLIDDKVISLDIFEKHFICDISKCLGACCVHGDSGAPLEQEEMEILKRELPVILPYLTQEGKQAIKEQGVAVIDDDHDLVTPLLGSREECAYAYFTEGGVCLCGIEKAYFDKKTTFRKPISCHLYPIRLRKIGTQTALNYDQWNICGVAREKGLREGVPVFRFLKEPIIRRFDSEFYNALEIAYNEIVAEKSKNNK